MKSRFTLLLLLVGLAVSGCESKKTAQAQTRAAYAAGRAAAYQQLQEQQRTALRVVGNVRTPDIAWEDGMTLAAVLLVAEYQGHRAPRNIFIERRNQRVAVDMPAFLKGEDVALQPGDIVVISEH